MSSETRKYEQRKRAESVAQTRRRITEAAVELHGTLGPARTTLSAVAERAGVQRQTLYRHFPDERRLLDACSAMFWTENPPPDAAAWQRITDPAERLRAGLAETYAYYERNVAMMANIMRDLPFLPDGAQLQFAPFAGFFERAVAALSAGWGVRGARARTVRAAVRHVLGFATWDSLARDGGLPRDEVIRLAAALVGEATAP